MSLYRDKKVLVVDDFPEFRMSIRQMLLLLKIEDIHMASSGEEALRQCQAKRFDIVLSDYNLGDGKDGQQLLEELRAYKLLRHRSIFMMLTAESTAFMVMGALENSPDSYLTKPFTRQDLKSRLDRLIDFKDEFERVNLALDQGAHNEVVAACDQLIDTRSANASHALRIKAASLLKMDEIEQAEKLFTAALSARPLPWAQMGMAHIHFVKQEHQKSIDYLDEIIRTNENYLAAYDLLAENHMALNNAPLAQQVLSKAIQKSAKSPQRQHRLGDVAKENKDLDTAVRAYRRTVDLSNNGLHEDPNNVLDFVSILADKLATDSSLAGKRAGIDALAALNKYKKDIRKDPDTTLRGKVLEAKVYIAQGNKTEAAVAAQEAQQQLGALESQPPAKVMAELIDVLLKLKETEPAANLLEELQMFDLSDDPKEREVRALVSEFLDNQDVVEFHNTKNPDNQKGIELYDQGDLAQAIEQFRSALETSAHSITVNLNLAQSLIKNMQTNKVTPDLLQESSQCFARIGEVAKENHRFKRHQSLLELQHSLEKKLR